MVCRRMAVGAQGVQEPRLRVDWENKQRCLLPQRLAQDRGLEGCFVLELR